MENKLTENLVEKNVDTIKTENIETSFDEKESNGDVNVKIENNGDNSNIKKENNGDIDIKMETIDKKENPVVKEETNGDIDVKMEMVDKQENPVVTKEIKKKISHQMEYYFGNYNHPRDRYLNEQIKANDGWMPISKILNFKRLASLSTDVEVILQSIESSKIIEIDESRQKLRRSVNNPVPPFEGDLKEEFMNKTVYVKGFPKDRSVDLDILLKYFKQYGPVDTIYMRNFHDQAKQISGFKGSVLVVFSTRELAEAFLEKFDLKYKSTPLLRMWYEDYKEEKKKEIEERLKRKEERKNVMDSNKEQIDNSFPKGTYLHMSDVPSGTTREDIKASLTNFTSDLAFIGFRKDEVEGYLRFKTEGCNGDMLSLLQGKLKVKDTELTLRTVEGEEEETQINAAKEARLNSMNNHRPGKRNFSKGKFGQRGGPPNKRRKFNR